MRKTFNITGLDCAHCAVKLEDALRKIDGDFGDVDMYKYPMAVGRIGFLKG